MSVRAEMSRYDKPAFRGPTILPPFELNECCYCALPGRRALLALADIFPTLLEALHYLRKAGGTRDVTV